ncbi:FMR1-interacting protein NUFIP1 isoform 2-T2 [Polymixia lowei]
MNGSGHYPPPDFDCPQNLIIKPPTSQHQSNNFHPSMWSWYETPSDPRDYSGHGAWQCGASGSGFEDHDGRYGRPAGPTPAYGKNFHRGWHQGGHRGVRHNYGPPNNHGKKKNTKEPEFAHFCDTCDRGFKNQEKYNEHMSQHVKCSVPDCSFTAHEKIVSIHWKNNHAPGAKRIKLDTPDEIAKWREERRKNYPTIQNLERKRKILEVREKGGGVLDTAQFGRMRGRGRGRGWGNRSFQKGPPRGPPNPECSASKQPPHTLLPRDGDPLGALVSSDPDSDKEEPTSDSSQTGMVVAPKQMSSGLGSLLANYGSMSESEGDEEPDAIPIQRANQLVQENQALLNTLPPRTRDWGPSGGTQPSSQGTETHHGTPSHTPWRGRGGRGRGRGRGRGGRGGRGRHDMETPQKRRTTLLEMLLAPDIRHERNVLLQCVRYIVRNNFFGLENRPQNQEGTKATPAITAGHLPRTQEMTSEEPRGSTAVVGGGKGRTGSVVMPSQGGCRGHQTIQQGSSETALLADMCRDVSPSSTVDPSTSGTAFEQCTLQNCTVTETAEKDVLSEQVCSAQARGTPVDSTQSAERVLIQIAEQTTGKTCHDLGVTSTDKVTPASYIYDDEIWESPGADM